LDNRDSTAFCLTCVTVVSRFTYSKWTTSDMQVDHQTRKSIFVVDETKRAVSPHKLLRQTNFKINTGP